MTIEGWQQLVDWMGDHPVFHDAEIAGLTLSNSGTSQLLMTAKGRAGDEKKVLVELWPPIDVRVEEWDTQNVILELLFSEQSDGYLLSISASNGAVGTLKAGRVRISFVT